MYATVADMITRFDAEELLELSDPDGAGTIGQAIVEAALSDASYEIDSYLGRYKLPLPETPQVLRRYCCEIARYFLYKGSAPERVQTAYDDAKDWLTKLSTGKVTLQINGTDVVTEAPAAENTILFDGPERVFSRQSMRGF
ncbi:gp436 family protein [Asticcacaulis sp. YBE204]|uniref:gp436 family protein n=1 Tax=Asticcacaulis sp. YBE204 TaxID=1282363 RepID=UPI0003C3D6F3|nr:phage protein Gp36 family protein [Asticcacaulis sp. YBE204]ESQ78509.1 hypothetical protein AEYBE204_13235 [Asticcacaulis sp. YBE204]